MRRSNVKCKRVATTASPQDHNIMSALARDWGATNAGLFSLLRGEAWRLLLPRRPSENRHTFYEEADDSVGEHFARRCVHMPSSSAVRQMGACTSDVWCVGEHWTYEYVVESNALCFAPATGVEAVWFEHTNGWQKTTTSALALRVRDAR